MFPVINILGLNFETYHLCIALAVVLSAVIAVIHGLKNSLNIKNGVLALMSGAVGAFLGGHLFYAALNFDKLIALIANMVNITFYEFASELGSIFGGTVYFGWLFGAVLGLQIYGVWLKRQKLQALMDILGISAVLIRFFTMVGAFLGGYYYGIESRFGILIKHNAIVPESAGVKRIPVAAIEAYFGLLLFLMLWTAFRAGKFKGRILYLYMLFYSAVRFGMEFLRGEPNRKVLFGINPIQLLCVVVFAGMVLYFLVHIKSTFKDLLTKGEGKLSTRRGCFKMVMLSLLTFGIYGFGVMCSLSCDINVTASKYDQKRTMHYFWMLLLFVVTAGVAGFVWSHRISARIGKELSRRNIDYLFGAGDFWLWNIIGLIVVIGPLVYLHKLLKAVNLINKDYNKKQA